MPIDEALLEAHASYRSEPLGISEQFVRLDAGPARTWGVLSMPLGERRSTAWLVCHSFGLEQVDLHMTDVAMARALAAEGHPTLRFHCQGYGESDDLSHPPTVSAQLRDTLDVIRQVPGLTGVDRIGLAGSRVGAAVAALAADATGAPDLILVQPVVKGSKYVTEMLRARVVIEMLGETPWAATTVEELREELAEHGMVNIKGWRLGRDAVEDLEKVDLMKLEHFSGKALIVQVSRGESVQGPVTRLAKRLEEIGATAEVQVLTHPSAPNFGNEHFRPSGRDTLGDVLEGVNTGLVEQSLAWVRSQSPEAAA
jgi:pimeloyl-ACP methyl ester carboxylesterase